MESTDKIVKRLNALKRRFPKSVRIVRFVVEDDNDWMGNPALRILAILDNSSTPADVNGKDLLATNLLILDEIHREGEPRWPFVSYRTEAEHMELTGT